jgi:hypothetical protein
VKKSTETNQQMVKQCREMVATTSGIYNKGSAAGLGSRGLIDYQEYGASLGSRIVSEHLLKLRTDFPWVKPLKPEREVMMPLLRFLSSFKEKTDHSSALKPLLLQRASNTPPAPIQDVRIDHRRRDVGVP